MSRIFDQGNAVLNGFVKELLALEQSDHVLEIGFGTGKLISEMAELTGEGLIEGIDFSGTMVAMAARRNKTQMANGRVKLEQGDFEKTAYPDNRFNKVCSTNTIYFWPNPESYLNRILTLLKPGGNLILAFEDRAQLEGKKLNSDLFRVYEENEVKQLLVASGFVDVDIRSKKVGSSIYHCAVAAKSNLI
ncbi:MAG: class I SAM-dependent methyltransferase [Desulfobacterales bacterium]|nr:class I SAM-dependent methyltransferase [Desulfobacterales bacterium]